MSHWRRRYHWRFDPITYVWQLWLEDLGETRMRCMGWLTAECVAAADLDLKAVYLDNIRRQMDIYALEEAA